MFFFASIVTRSSSNCHAFSTDALLKLVYVPLVYHGTFLRDALFVQHTAVRITRVRSISMKHLSKSRNHRPSIGSDAQSILFREISCERVYFLS